MSTIQQEITGSLEAKPDKYGIFESNERIIFITGFKPVKVIDGNIFVTDEPEFIEILKEMAISGKRRSTEKQRKIECSQ